MNANIHDINKQIAKIIKEVRNEKGLTQEELADKLGKNLKYISQIENAHYRSK